MNIRRELARLLGYGGYEYERSPILKLPVRIISDEEFETMTFDENWLPSHKYPKGVQVIRNEIGTDGKHRLIASEE